MALSAPAYAASNATATSGEPLVVEVAVKPVPTETLLTRRFAGNYNKHQQFLSQLQQEAQSLGVPQGNSYYGIYPMDPDAIPSDDELVWYLAVPAAPGTVSRSFAYFPGLVSPGVRADIGTLESGFLSLPAGGEGAAQMATMSYSMVLTTASDYSRIAIDGLAMKQYMYENSYVQVAPTMTLLTSGSPSNPAEIGLDIIFPVKRRSTILPVSSVQVKWDDGSGNPPGDVVPVTLASKAAQTVMVETINGGFDNHAERCAELLATATAVGVPKQSSCTKIELIDPEAADNDRDVIWQLAVQVPDGTIAPAPYQIATLPGGDVLTRATTEDRRLLEVLAINSWLLEEGYIHASPRRYTVSPDPMNDNIVMELPVTERLRQIPLTEAVVQEVSTAP